MKVVWSPTADRNADAIWEYIAQDNIDAADAIAELVRAAADRLRDYPLMGKEGRTPRSREIVVAGTPYILVYRVSKDRIEIARVLHGRQDWPRKP